MWSDSLYPGVEGEVWGMIPRTKARLWVRCYLTQEVCLLQAYSVYDEEVGYCQGLSFLAASLLLHVSDSCTPRLW